MKNNIDWGDLKSAWKKQNVEVDDQLIIASLQKKSLNNIKLIVIIAAIEFVVIVLSNLLLKTPSEDAHLTITQRKFFQSFLKISDNIFIANTFLSLGFLMVFYKLYRKIRVKNSVKDYMHGILLFRKWVNGFIIWNIFLGIVLASTIGYYGFVEGYNSMVTAEKRITDVNPFQSKMGWFVVLFLAVLAFIVSWIYYTLIYGIVLRKLKRNWRELRKFEEE